MRTYKNWTEERLGQFERFDIAVIGMSCRFPGANRYSKLWENLAAGRNSISEIIGPNEAQERETGRMLKRHFWDINQFYSPEFEKPGKSISKWGGFLEQVDQFDNKFFNISPREAKNMDPQQRLLLEETWECIEDSGIPLTTLNSKITSVYVGVMAMDYYTNVMSPRVLTESFSAVGNYGCILSNRLSYYYGFTGISKTIDTACSSSLVAINSACRAFYLGETDYAIIAGVNLSYSPFKYVSFSKARMLSPDGQCKTFDKDANGYVPGEGIGVVLLQPLHKAEEEGNHVFGVIKGSAVNHVGHSIALTAPKVDSQMAVVRHAMNTARVTADTINYIEAHGTGTSLGDPIEVEGLTRTFQQDTDKNQFCKIGSIKTNIGHLEAAAGIAGVIKVLLMFKHKKIPRSLNVKTLNPVINFEKTPFAVALEASDWESVGDNPRRAGVSSFGFGGVNGHVILEEYRDYANDKTEDSNTPIEIQTDRHPQVFLLSAKTPSSLQKMLGSWKNFIAEDDFKHLKLEAICHTLKYGREIFRHRFGLVVENKQSLINTLSNADNYTRSDEFQQYTDGAKKSLVFRVGNASNLNIYDFKFLSEHDPVFKESYEECRNAIADISFLNVIDKGDENTIFEGTAGETYQRLYHFALLYSIVKSTLAKNVNPNIICGEGLGKWVVLCICGVIDIRASLLGMINRAYLDYVPLKRPRWPLYLQSIDKVIHQFYFDETYKQHLIQEIGVPDEEILGQIRKAHLLIDSQFTFKKLMAGWDSNFAPGERGVNEMLNNENWLKVKDEKTESDKVLFLFIILSCMRELNKKWNLTEHLPKMGAGAYELLDLISDRLITQREVIQLFQPDFKDYTELADRVHERQEGLDTSKPYNYLRERSTKIAEIQDQVDWIREFIRHPLPKDKFANALTFNVGKFQNLDTGFHHIRVDLEKNPEENLSKGHLQLWLRGVDIDWSKFPKDENASRTTSLPVYSFSRQSFWIDPEGVGPEQALSSPAIPKTKGPSLAQGNVETLSKLQQVSPQGAEPFYQRTLTPIKDPIIQDHQITQKKLIPGALMIEMGLESAQRYFTAQFNQMSDIEILNPGVAETDILTEVTLSKDSNEFEVLGRGSILATGCFSNGSIAPLPSFEVPNSQSKPYVPNQPIYDWFKAKGYNYGPSLQVIDAIWEYPEYWVAKLVAKNTVEGQVSGMDPALLDGVFQFLLWAGGESQKMFVPNSLLVPHKIAKLHLLNGLHQQVYVCVYKKDLILEGMNFLTHTKVYNTAGKGVLEIKEMRFKRVPFQFLENQPPTLRPASQPAFFYEPLWVSGHSWPELKPTNRLSIIFGNFEGLGTQVQQKLQQLGNTPILIEYNQQFQKVSESHFQINYNRLEDFQQLLQAIAATVDPKDPNFRKETITFYYLGSCQSKGVPQTVEEVREQQEHGILPLFSLAKSLLLSPFKNSIQLVAATKDTFVVDSSDTGHGYGYGGILGLGKVIQRENKRVIFKHVDFSSRDSLSLQEQAQFILAESQQDDGENAIAVRAGKRFLKKQRQVSVPLPSSSGNFRNNGVYIIVGGLGGIGLKLATTITNQVKANLILIGRSDLNEAKQNQIRELRKKGSNVLYIQADITDIEQTQEIVDYAKEKFQQINGIIHAGGHLEDQFMSSKSIESFQRVISSKIYGTWALDQATQTIALDFFMVFSSIVSVIGNFGQSDYASANSFLDAFVHYRNQRKTVGKTIGINWTLWKDGGMGTEGAAEKQLESLGVRSISGVQGVQAFEQILNSSFSQVIVLGDEGHNVKW